MSRERLIELEGISKTFRSSVLRRPKRALLDLELSIEEGEIFGFLGPNGAGKTTTIKILTGLIRPSAGRGHVLHRSFGSPEALRELGFLPDSPCFYRYLTARELLRFTGSLHGMEGEDLERRIEDTLERVRLAPEAWDRALRTFSRGMLQRTGIAAAILHRPRLVIFDEPMNGLDPLGRHDLRDLILSLRQDRVTVFFSSHVLADIESTADRVAILHEGRLIECGALGEILSTDEGRVEISFRLPPGREPGEITSRLQNVRRSGGEWIGEASDAAQGSRVTRRILEAGGVLSSYRRRRISLEEFFVRRVSGFRPALGEVPLAAPSGETLRRGLQPRERQEVGS